MYCFPDLFPFGVGGRKEEREEPAQLLRYEKTRLLSSNAQFTVMSHIYTYDRAKTLSFILLIRRKSTEFENESNV